MVVAMHWQCVNRHNCEKEMNIKFLMVFFVAILLVGCKANTTKQPTVQVVAPSDKRQLVLEVQKMLFQKGYDPGPKDGLEGSSTRAALRSFQDAQGLPATVGVTKEAYTQLVSGNENTRSKNDSRECVRNFKKQSGLRNYRTTAILDGVDQKLATQRLVRALSRESFVINDKNGSRGYVNATFDAGSVNIQLSAFIEQRGRGSHVELNYAATGSGMGLLFVPGSTYQNDLCEFVEAMR